MRILCLFAPAILLACSAASAGDRCYFVSDSVVQPIEGAANVDLELPTLLMLTEEHALGFVPEAKELRVKWIGKYHDYFAEANWRRKNRRIEIDWGDGLNGASFDLAEDGEDLVGTVEPYADVRNEQYHPLVRNVRLRRAACPAGLD